MIKAVIFDRNDVLHEYDLDFGAKYFAPLLPISIYELGERWYTWGAIKGFPTDIESEKVFWQTFWEQLSNEFNLSTEIRLRVQAFRYTDVLSPFPDASPTLQALKNLGLKIGILSNFPLVNIESALEAIGMLDFIDICLSSSNIGVAKPAPEAYEKIINVLDVDYSETIFVDNTLEHIQAARHLGMHAYLLNRKAPNNDLASGIIHELTILLELYNVLNYQLAS